MQKRLLDALGARHAVKTLPEFGIERAAQLAGCTANHLRNLETRGDLPGPRLVEAGSTQRRIYNYNEVNHIREIIGKPSAGLKRRRSTGRGRWYESAQVAKESGRLDRRGRLARYKIPRFVEFIASLPISAAGKVLRWELRELQRQSG
ncbi:MAG: hypothetical protein LM522_09510 [Candidatus Contendobacter sp.]|nr:hypothetical protein [Candidatus Contendobacter sp.]